MPKKIIAALQIKIWRNGYLIKDHTHDYAVAAFVFYAACGCPSDEDVQRMLYKWAEKNHDSVEVRNKRRHRRILTEKDLIMEKVSQIEKELDCCIADIAAVNCMLADVAQSSMGEDKVKCIRYVYFCRGVNFNARGSMSALVQKCVTETGLNESFIYRSLRQAREIFMQKRGLRSSSVTETAAQVFGFDM